MPTTTVQNNSVDHKKLEELVLYLCRKSEADEKFGMTKLNKLLFFSDYAFYAEHRKSITGEEYQKLARGPAPKQMKPVLERLKETGNVAVMQRDYFGHPQQKPYAKREPDLSGFTGEEIALVDYIIETLRPLSGSDVSDISHRFPGWLLVNEGEIIPYQAVHIDYTPLSQEDKDYAKTIDLTGVEELLKEYA